MEEVKFPFTTHFSLTHWFGTVCGTKIEAKTYYTPDYINELYMYDGSHITNEKGTTLYRLVIRDGRPGLYMFSTIEPSSTM